MKKILLSGIQASGTLHIGNYFGAMKQFVDLQGQYDCRIFIADLHALTSLQNSDELNKNIIETAIGYLSVGLDPNKVILYKQSDTPEVSELGWIFNCITTMPYLMRAHAFKSAEAKSKEVNVGVFDYPMLMAADILISDPDVVPVGADQKQHVEIARDTAEKFNRIFGKGKEILKMPEALIKNGVATVPGIDGQKMSKSYNNTIPLFGSDEEIRKQVMSIVTDSGADMPKNVYAIHALLKDKKALDELYEGKKGKYKDLKEALIADLISFVAPLRERKREFEADIPKVIQILQEGGKKAKKIASKKMEQVRKAVGVSI